MGFPEPCRQRLSERKMDMSFTYRGLKATTSRHIVTGEEIDRQLERMRQQNPRIAVITDRPTQLGDEVVLDYAGYCDGVQFAGGTAQRQTLVLGSGAFIPGFEEQLVDKVCEEEVTVNVTFPTEYHAPELAGKAAQFHCKIHEIRVKTQHQLDDTFAKEVGGCGTLEEMREKLGNSLQDYTDERGEMDLADRLIRQAAETLEFTPSDAQVEAEMDDQMRNLTAQLAQQGLTMEMYCQFLNTTEAAVREDSRADALASIRIQAAVETIVELEGLDVTEEEMGTALASIARQNHMTVAELKNYSDGEFNAAVRRSVLTGKAMALVRKAAEITEIPE